MSQNPEQQLLASLASGLGVVVSGRASFPDPKNLAATLYPGEPWPPGAQSAWRSPNSDNPLAVYNAYLAAAEKGGSQNQDKLCLCCLFTLGSNAEKAAANQASLALFQSERDVRGWMGSEPLSRVDYGLWHLDHALLSVRYGSTATKEIAWEWLDLYAFVLRSTWDAKLRRCLFYGERSAEAGHDLPAAYDWLAGYLVGAFSWMPNNTLDDLILAKLRPEIDEWKARPLANPGWKTEQPITLYQGSDGSRAVLLGREMNHNTPACCAASTAGGVLRFAPPTPWPAREREQNTGGFAREQAGQIVYTSTDKNFPTTTLQLPPGALRSTLGSGSPTFTVGAAPPSGPQPVQPTPQGSPSAPQPPGPNPSPAPTPPAAPTGFFATLLSWLGFALVVSLLAMPAAAAEQPRGWDPTFLGASAALVAASLFDAETTVRAERVGARELNLLHPHGRAAVYGVALAFDALQIGIMRAERRRGMHWWLLPAVGIAGHGIAGGFNLRVR